MSAVPVEQLLDDDAVRAARRAIAATRSYGPLRAVTPDQAPNVRTATDYDRTLRPLRQRGGDGVHVHLPPAAYAQGRRYVRTRHPVIDDDGRSYHRRRADTGAPLVQWRSREHWLTVILPTAVAHAPEDARTATGAIRLRHGASVSVATLTAYAEQLSKYAHPGTGRRCIVRVDTAADLTGISKRTAQRCQEALELLGLYVVMLPGRMLDQDETYRARAGGSRQRGLANDAALVVPHWLPRPAINRPEPPPSRTRLRLIQGGHVTPTSGRNRKSSRYLYPVPSDREEQPRFAGKNAPPPAARHRRRSLAGPGVPSGPQKAPVRRTGRVYDAAALELARDLTEHVGWLTGVPPGRLEVALRRFVRCRLPWTVRDVIAAIDQTNARLGRASMTRTLVTNPPALLAKYLRDFDVDADHPRHGAEPGASPEPEAVNAGRQRNLILLATHRDSGAGHDPGVRAAAIARIRADLRDRNEPRDDQ